MHLAHVHGLVDGLPPTAVVAGVLAHASGRSRQRVVEDDAEEGLLQPVLLVELQEARDVHVQRARVLAWAQGEVLADTGAATLGQHVVLELVPEVAQAGEHRVGRTLAQPAERHVAGHAAELVELVEVLQRGRAVGEAVEHREGLVEAHAAGHALAARLGVGELHEVARDVDHAVVFVHHDHAARAHDRADLGQRLVVDGRVEHVQRDAAAGGTAGLHRLDLAAVGGAAADVVDELGQGRAQGHLHEAGVLDLAHEREDLGAGALGRAGVAEPGWSAGHDGRHVVPGLDVVDVGGLAVEAALGGERRPRPGSAGLALERGDERRLLAADEGAGALDDLDVEVEAAAHDVRAHEAVLASLGHRAFEAHDRDGVLGPHVDDAVAGTGGVARDEHALEQRVGVGLDLVAVHVGAGVALVRVADEVLLGARRPWPGTPTCCR